MDTQRSDETPEPTSGGAPQAGPGDYRAPDGLHIPPRPPAPHPSPAYGTVPPARYSAPAPHGHAFGQAAHPQLTQPTQPLPKDLHGGAGQDRQERAKPGAGRVAALLVAAALVGGAAGLGGSYAGDALWGSDGAPGAASGPSNITVNNPGSVNEATAVATEVLPSVVTIEVAGGSESGSGSGVVLSEDGYVVTNTHVVTLGGATGDAQIRVTASDGRIYEAEIVGTDPTYDLAVIKLADAQGLTPIEFADSAKLNVGDMTVAVGAPLGLSNTVTTGIVSALNRSIEIASAATPEQGDEAEETPEQEQESPWFFDIPGQEYPGQARESISIAVIQTDAAINPGNSGGALVDSQGRLIGVNVAIATASGSSGESGSIGVGFAIPSNVVQRVTDELIAEGKATHGLLGASVTPASAARDATTAGALIEEVTPGGAAEQAGLRAGDIVTEFNGVRIGSAVDLTAQVRAAAGGSQATLTYVREGESHTIDVTLGSLGE
ncbi:PDZ domain-containing protein [Microbacterium sp. MEC084]|uniref:S1C family serine protease n=1 Tax=Microbacterium sp. MEC084 TaxID=1963027 RepID=UPI00106F7415|nr:trypsin-like peptidase domain-containing protein [Microbacterium sp. MEC084]MCD1267555.1 PDZ domain-containing protein [Microbacterium sp. MEC084]